MIDITILVCLYKKSIEESDTIQSLLKANIGTINSTIYIWDNSPESLNEESLVYLSSNFRNFIYNHTPENVPLSKIYNNVISSLTCENCFLMLCDDDSNIPVNFFGILENQIRLHPSINLFLPQIYSDTVLVSPAKDYFVFTKYIKNLNSGLLKSKYTTAINSGMVISNRVFKAGFKYNESLKFYGTDNYFMLEYARLYPQLNVLDVNIIHNLSYNTSDDVENKIRIFKEIRKANKIIYKKYKLTRAIVMLNNLLVSLKLSLKYKTIFFFFDKDK
ncbi:hypothetical protein [Flavobacterium sp. UMI-01]|uniref:hypothetical protein n=1 Tax=Flavobacterium sp. UMI-01 TaxID=1441053 RepID=UPI001C7DDD12|nr:hypothetical protein [Flavobacterium sp. UMI-01]GIZ07431.1 hypothetical protein FUMI01_01580 [Flavobacterium sp. UMI-01]